MPVQGGTWAQGVGKFGVNLTWSQAEFRGCTSVPPKFEFSMFCENFVVAGGKNNEHFY